MSFLHEKLKNMQPTATRSKKVQNALWSKLDGSPKGPGSISPKPLIGFGLDPTRSQNSVQNQDPEADAEITHWASHNLGRSYRMLAVANILPFPKRGQFPTSEKLATRTT